MKGIFQLFNLLGALAIFLYGMKMMSDGLQKASGDKLRHLLSVATANRFTAMLCGVFITGVIQSSSATTVMVVGFTSAGLLSLYQALGVIFGANIGTTTTAWIVSLFGFKVQISLFALPVIALGFFMQFVTKRTWGRRIGETLVGFGLLFLGLSLMKDAIPADLATNEHLTAWLSRLSPLHLGNLLILILSGTILTIILQSSSAVMAMTLTCAAAGLLDFPAACALVLGENIGTTVTANLAALGGSNNARRAALGHFLFNTIGVLWVVAIFPYFISLVDWLIPGSPSLQQTAELNAALPYHISAFHTVFNILNTAVMLPLLKPLAKLTLFFIPKTKREDKNEYDLQFLATGFMQTPELALLAIRKELERMMGFVSRMGDKVIHALKVEDEKMFYQLIEDIQEAEKATDVLEHKINVYLTKLTHGNLSRHAVAQSFMLFDVVTSIERMGDCGEKIARILEKFHTKEPFSPADIEDLETITRTVKEITKRPRRLLIEATQKSPESAETNRQQFEQAVKEENNLNTLRKQLLRDRRDRILDGRQNSSPDAITAYADIVNNLERIGDYALRIDENLLGFHAQDSIPVLEKETPYEI